MFKIVADLVTEEFFHISEGVWIFAIFTIFTVEVSLHLVCYGKHFLKKLTQDYRTSSGLFYDVISTQLQPYRMSRIFHRASTLLLFWRKKCTSEDSTISPIKRKNCDGHVTFARHCTKQKYLAVSDACVTSSRVCFRERSFRDFSDIYIYFERKDFCVWRVPRERKWEQSDRRLERRRCDERGKRRDASIDLDTEKERQTERKGWLSFKLWNYQVSCKSLVA